MWISWVWNSYWFMTIPFKRGSNPEKNFIVWSVCLKIFVFIKFLIEFIIIYGFEMFTKMLFSLINFFLYGKQIRKADRKEKIIRVEQSSFAKVHRIERPAIKFTFKVFLLHWTKNASIYFVLNCIKSYIYCRIQTVLCP